MRIYELVSEKYRDCLLVHASVFSVSDDIKAMVERLENNKWARQSYSVSTRKLATGDMAVDVCRDSRTRAKNAVTVILHRFSNVLPFEYSPNF